MLELSFNNVDKYMGTTLVLKDVNFRIFEGDFVGLIGANGSGKSTILKLIAGIIELKLFPGSWSKGYDRGWICKPNCRISYLDQVPSYDMNVQQVLELAFEDVRSLEGTMRVLEDEMAFCEDEKLVQILNSYSRITERFEALGGYDMAERFSKICTGLDLHQYLEQDFMTLSGGEQTTVLLGKILMESPDILLLDEPTNHLDLNAILWLESYLRKYQGIVIAVSHDRQFLNSASKIIEIEDLTTKTYKGNYSDYRTQKTENLRVQSNQYREQQKLIQRMKAQILELRAWAQKADQKKFYQRAESIQVKMDKMQLIKKPVFERRNIRLDLAVRKRAGQETITFKNVSKSYDGQRILHTVSGLIRYGERVAILGENGSGKSTLMKLLMGEVQPDCGEIKIASSAQIGYLPQQIQFNHESWSVLETFKEDKDIDPGTAREYLAKFMFYGKSVFTEVGKLSGGERLRLRLALLLYQEKNVLIFDEPTNHLDIETIETLENALSRFTGTLVFISHDRYFANRMATRFLLIEDQKIRIVEAFEDQIRTKEVVKSKSKPKVKKIESDEKNIEDMIVSSEHKLEQIEGEMLDKEIDYKQLMTLQAEKEVILTEIESLYERL